MRSAREAGRRDEREERSGFRTNMWFSDAKIEIIDRVEELEGGADYASFGGGVERRREQAVRRGTRPASSHSSLAAAFLLAIDEAAAMSSPTTLSLKQMLTALPPVSSSSTELRAQMRREIQSNLKKPILVALDDDPTGTQTCHDVPVLTTWSVPVLRREFENTKPGSGFFILTNSRALHPPAAKALTIEMCTNLSEAAMKAGKAFEVVLRGDSTLRGHFPLELEAVEEVLGQSDAWILAPFFLQGGRYTIDDVHYVAEGDTLVAAANIPFAKDATFGYKSSNLRDWLVEKSKGAIVRERVQSPGLSDIRSGGPNKIGEILQHAKRGTVFIVNAATEEDMDVVVLGILKASAQGKKFLFRSGAPPVSAKQLSLERSRGGLIIAGSYIPKTTAQLKTLRERAGDRLTTVELDVNKLLESPDCAEKELQHALVTAESELQKPQDVLIMTSRKLITRANERSSLDIGSTVAAALVSFLTRLETRPRFIIAKGGITSSDMATKGLNMKRAMAVGQAAAGVPLWRCNEPTCKYPGLPYVVFPGSVGGVEALAEVVERWRA
ncbi:hypothetical protein BU26DRAFT_551868 [Trematosphaeria pertusa]|uniref:Ketose-bisphosphate aldolase class-II family protein n=1 Tax=Trematosphaeria pertusa TaxID=390896 RepID=A0A6A6I8V7_9PLEO|nr:uncharacterized protein BU26DRAFT_551868 [Trematosphaeria pertusa]KAF2246994.1 hypothetical protein BU26DRAFT_551868 [Trematosphaeria pertusa]